MERRKVIMHAQGILDGLTAAHQALSGDDSGEMMGAADLLGSVVNELVESARLDESLAPLSERLSDLYYGARELATDLADRLTVMILTRGAGSNRRTAGPNLPHETALRCQCGRTADSAG